MLRNDLQTFVDEWDWTPSRMNVWDRFFDSFERSFSMPYLFADTEQYRTGWSRRETDTHILLTMDLPGVNKNDVQIDVQGQRLKITAERKDTESIYRKWREVFTLPEGAVSEEIACELKDGVLKIAIPKAESARSRTIKISDGKDGLFSRLIGKLKKDEPADVNENMPAKAA